MTSTIRAHFWNPITPRFISTDQIPVARIAAPESVLHIAEREKIEHGAERRAIGHVEWCVYQFEEGK